MHVLFSCSVLWIGFKFINRRKARRQIHEFDRNTYSARSLCQPPFVPASLISRLINILLYIVSEYLLTLHQLSSRGLLTTELGYTPNTLSQSQDCLRGSMLSDIPSSLSFFLSCYPANSYTRHNYSIAITTLKQPYASTQYAYDHEGMPTADT